MYSIKTPTHVQLGKAFLCPRILSKLNYLCAESGRGYTQSYISRLWCQLRYYIWTQMRTKHLIVMLEFLRICWKFCWNSRLIHFAYIYAKSMDYITYFAVVLYFLVNTMFNSLWYDNNPWSPFYSHGLTLIPAWILNHKSNIKYGTKLLIHSQTWTFTLLKFMNV